MKIKRLKDIEKVLQDAQQNDKELYRYMLYLLFQRKEDINEKIDN